MTTPVLLWADVESDGLGPSARLLEIGLRTTDADLTTLAERSWVIPYRPTEMGHLRRSADPVVQAMHDTSGLWKDCVRLWESSDQHREETPLDREYFWRRDIASEILDWVRVNAPGKLPLAGSSVRADRDWLTAWAWGLDDLLHYRIVDVSTVKTLMHLWAKDRLADAPVPAKRHRVMPDLDDSVQELKFYRSILGLDVTAVAL